MHVTFSCSVVPPVTQASVANPVCRSTGIFKNLHLTLKALFNFCSLYLLRIGGELCEFFQPPVQVCCSQRCICLINGLYEASTCRVKHNYREFWRKYIFKYKSVSLEDRASVFLRNVSIHTNQSKGSQCSGSDNVNSYARDELCII